MVVLAGCYVDYGIFALFCGYWDLFSVLSRCKKSEYWKFHIRTSSTRFQGSLSYKLKLVLYNNG